MSILVDKNSRVLTQGITGAVGQLHTRACKEYGTNMIGGVVPVMNLPGFKPMGDGSEGEFAGSPAYQVGGTWVDNGQTKAVAQKTVVLDGSDGIYVLRLNADCLDNQIDKALPATINIDEKTKITGLAPPQ